MKKSLLLKGDTYDDQVIMKVERALKLKKNVSKHKKKARCLFKKDGLDYILDVTDMNMKNCCQDSNKRIERHKHEGIGKEDEHEIIEYIHDYNSSFVGKHRIEDCYGTEESTESICDNAEETKFSKVLHDEVKEQGGQLHDEQQHKGCQVQYHGHLKVSNRTENKTQSFERLKRQLKGLINRLSESNIQSVSSEIESLYMRNSRNDLNEILLSIIEELIIMPTLKIQQRLVMEQALLIAILQANTNSEVGTFILIKLIAKLNCLFNSGASYGSGKLCDNILYFVGELYSFKVCSSILIFDILKHLTDSFQDKDIDLILLLMQSVGGTLRKDNPLKMKEIIQYVQLKAFSVKEIKSSRVRFMLETLTAVHYNNLCKISNFSNSVRDHLKKVLKNCLRPGCSMQEICVSYEDMIKLENVSGSFQDNAFFKKIQFGKMKSTEQNFSQPNIDCQVLKLACQQHMNTESRKSIFCIIMSAEDYIDAFQKLLHLDSENQFGSDTMNIIVHCALHEKSFNPYYALLAGMFSKFSHKYHMSLQFSLWDRFKVLHTFKMYQIRNFSSFMIELILKEYITLSVLKVIHFSEMNKHLVIFLKEILLALLLQESDEDFVKVFKCISSDKKLDYFREEIYLFMVHFLSNEEPKHNVAASKKLEGRAKLVERIFNFVKKQ